MKKTLFTFLTLFVSFGLFFASCSDDDNDAENDLNNIVALAQATDNLSSLVAAVQRAGLVDALSDANASLTVFAPTNAAFSAFLTANGFNSLEDVPVDLLRSVLLNHVLSSTVRSNAITDGYVKTLATFSTTQSNISLYVSTANNAVTLNNQSAVVTPDIEAANGVVHIVDAVIALPVLPTFVVSDPNFSILLQALTRSDLSADFVTTLSGNGPFTVFAPTNQAFLDVLAENNLAALSDVPAVDLEEILSYHVVSGNILAASLVDGQTVTTIGTGQFTINTTNGATITDENSRVAQIIATDVQANNGVIHAINKVLLPN